MRRASINPDHRLGFDLRDVEYRCLAEIQKFTELGQRSITGSVVHDDHFQLRIIQTQQRTHVVDNAEFFVASRHQQADRRCKRRGTNAFKFYALQPVAMDRIFIGRSDQEPKIDDVRDQIENKKGVVANFEEIEEHQSFPTAAAATLPGLAKCSLTRAATRSRSSAPGTRSPIPPNRSNAASKEPQRSSSDRNDCKA